MMMVICAVIASLAVGVLLGHWVCVGMFAMFRSHARQVAAARAPKAARLEAMRG